MSDIQVLANQVIILQSRLDQLVLECQSDRRKDGELIAWSRHRIQVLEDALNVMLHPGERSKERRIEMAQAALQNNGVLDQELKQYFYEPCREGCPFSARDFQSESAKREG